MALDMAMTEAAACGAVPPTLRLYQWCPWAISLGYHQSGQDIDVQRCRADHIDVVLRPTGGRAILHANEITYAVALPPSSRYFSDDVLSVYEIISRALIRALESLGLHVDFERAKKAPQDLTRGDLSTLCYASSVQYEISIAGRKLVGSAQRRIHGSALQHGSILIGAEHLHITKYLSAKSESWRDRVRHYMQKNTISLNQVSDLNINYNLLASALKSGFQQALGIRFVEQEITPSETAFAQKIMSTFSILAN